jgi:hypothetical protein
VSRTNLPHDHADCDAQPTDARLATHHVGLLGGAIELFHALPLIETRSHGSGVRILFQEAFGRNQVVAKVAVAKVM